MIRQSVQSTASDIGKAALMFMSDSLDCKKPFFITFAQTKSKWYHYVSYPEVKKPEMLPDYITDPEGLSLKEKTFYKNKLKEG